MADDVFAHHGVGHLSPSSLNLFIMQPAWALLKISGVKDTGVGPAAWRGSAIDKVTQKLAVEPDTPEDELQKMATAKFSEQEKEAVDDHGDKVGREASSLPKYIKHARTLFADLHERHGPPVDMQKKVKADLGFSVPVIGYYDFLYEGQVRDVKTGRVQKTLPYGPKRQVALYAYCTGTEPWVDYIGTTDAISHPVPDHAAHLEDLINAGTALANVLGRSEDIKECCRSVYPDFDHWLWSDSTIAAAREIWADV